MPVAKRLRSTTRSLLANTASTIIRNSDTVSQALNGTIRQRSGEFQSRI